MGLPETLKEMAGSVDEGQLYRAAGLTAAEGRQALASMAERLEELGARSLSANEAYRRRMGDFRVVG